MAPGEVPGPAVERLAAELLGVEAEAPPRELHAALLRRLREDDYLPDPSAHEALLVLLGRPVGPESRLREDAGRAEEERLCGEVEGFASGFFAIPVPQRRQRWQSLFQTCAAHDRLRDRLRGLKPGLGVDRGTIADRSATVIRLVDAILAMFVLRPAQRAVLRRQLVRDLRTDPALRDPDLTRARKRLLRAHPEVAALSHGLLAELARPHRSLQAIRRRSRIASVLHANIEDRPLSHISIVLILFGCVLLYVTYQRTQYPTPVSPRTTTSLPSRPTPPSPLFPTTSDRKPSPAFVRHFRDQFKAPIRRELAKRGKAIDEERLQRVVDSDAIPADIGSQYGGMATLVLLGLWDEEQRDRYATRLGGELARTGVSLDEAQLAEVARNCFPKPIQRQPKRPERPEGGSPGWPSRRVESP